ncbi:hypothetical protein AB1Y20_000983 [Prymnesium parvum]|uniref:Uncharacterized protein n=1 Tax=Prymnesium parvum TaxID=97485 RepID=A0AB34K6X5_PRYPA
MASATDKEEIAMECDDDGAASDAAGGKRPAPSAPPDEPFPARTTKRRRVANLRTVLEEEFASDRKGRPTNEEKNSKIPNLTARRQRDPLVSLPQHRSPVRRVPVSGRPRAAPSIRSRIAVEWGSEWFDGVVTSHRQGLNTVSAPATLYRVLYDATSVHRAQANWHDLSEIHWRPAAPRP